LQHTLARPAKVSGVGVHTGKTVNVVIKPAPAGAGISFLRTDVGPDQGFIRARADAVTDTRLCTTIGNADGVTVSTIEHLMAVFNALAIDNAIVEIDGPEMPILDGSCLPFVCAFDRAGRVAQRASRDYIEIVAPVEVSDGDKRGRLVPADRFEISFEIAFENCLVGRQSVDLVIEPSTFRDELANCRTFGFLHEVEALRAAGLARGGGLDNAVVIEGSRVLNPEGLRRADECVRHKVLDAVGDLYLLGAPLIGRYEGRYAGHAINNALVRELIGRPDCWRFAAPPPELALAV
jgi:UDP-3-O-[3-hydroxymyristoyl] N-acetylglucosamine deacetylase